MGSDLKSDRGNSINCKSFSKELSHFYCFNNYENLNHIVKFNGFF